MKRLLIVLALAGCCEATAPKPVLYSCKPDTVTVAGNHYVTCTRLGSP
jgi:hypothetical protein